MPVLLLKTVSRLFLKIRAAMTPGSMKIPGVWLKLPEIATDDRIALFISFAPTGAFSEHSIYHAKKWSEIGYKVILIAVTDDLVSALDIEKLSFTSGIYRRLNRGYDFGAWSAVIQQLPNIRIAKILAIVNDSIYGPLDGFTEFVDRAEQYDADIIGTTESMELQRHFQSFLVFFKNRAINHESFWNFWASVRTLKKQLVVLLYESRMLQYFSDQGLHCVAMFPAQDKSNPTLTRWRALVKAGFPFVKADLLHRNPWRTDIDDWEGFLRQNGYDPEIVRVRKQALAQQHI